MSVWTGGHGQLAWWQTHLSGLLVISHRHVFALLREVPGLTQAISAALSRHVRQPEERA